ncbi:MAG: hypothetical protein ABSB35_12160 [Bryobacteraceae bacterium]
MLRLFHPAPAFAVLLLSTTAASADGLTYQVSTVAGIDWGQDGVATQEILIQAEGIAADANGNLYVADALEQRVRKVTPAGMMTTVAGTGVQGFSGDGGPATAAQLNSPYGLTFDGAGNLYIADLGNARVRRITPDGIITTVAGGTATAAIPLVAPRNLAPAGNGAIYISDFGGHRVLRLGADGSLTAVAGTGVAGYSPDGALATEAQLAYPAGLAVDQQGSLYIADSQNHLVRKVANGVISTFAHAVTPTGLAIDGLGSLYIADPNAGTITQIPSAGSPTVLNVLASDLTVGRDGYLYAVDGGTMFRVSFVGLSTVLAGGGDPAFGDNGPATLARLNHPSAVAVDSSGNLYIADRDNDRIRRVSSNGTITTVAGTGVVGNTGDGGLATQAQLDSPASVSVDLYGDLYISDQGNKRVRMVTSGGIVLPVAAGGLVSPVDAVADPAGNLYIADAGTGMIVKLSAAGMSTLLSGLQSPGGIELDASGDLYYTDEGGHHVGRLDSSGNLTSFGAGIWSMPRGVAISATGDVYVADTGLQQILDIDSSGHLNPIGSAAELGFPWGVAVDSTGIIYVADLNNNRILRLTPAPAATTPTTTLNVVNAASLQSGPIAPGMLMLVLGTGLTVADLASTQLMIGGVAAPVLGILSNGLEVQAPAQIAASTNVQIEVSYGGSSLGQVAETVAAAEPALFAESSGQASSNNQDGTINSAANPAPRGSVIALYGTGEGVSGAPISVQIGGYPSDVLYAGPVAGFPGLLQVNARIPAGYIAPGNLAVTITVGQVSSQPGVTIAVN